MASDLLGIGKATESTELLTREIRELISPLLKPTVKEIGGLGGDVAHIARVRIREALTGVLANIAKKGVKPCAVDTNVLIPALNACSLEDNENMRRRWLNLLSTAACGEAV